MMTSPRRLVLVVCAAPPAATIDDLVRLLLEDGWTVDVIVTDAAQSWIDAAVLQSLTGSPVRVLSREPSEPKAPRPDAVVLAPATFNTINLWAAGVNNSPALGLLNEALCDQTPIVASPYVKEVLTKHPAFERNLTTLVEAGVLMTAVDALRPAVDNEPFQWHVILDLLLQVKQHLS
jgi:phosphopantothenoylcysteine decarboxylase